MSESKRLATFYVRGPRSEIHSIAKDESVRRGLLSKGRQFYYSLVIGESELYEVNVTKPQRGGSANHFVTFHFGPSE